MSRAVKCHGRENQRFTLSDNENGTTAAIIGHAGKCLDIRGGGTTDDTRAQLWRCHYHDNQELEYRGGTVLEDSHSNKYLAIAQASDRAKITLENCDGRPSEAWHLEH